MFSCIHFAVPQDAPNQPPSQNFGLEEEKRGYPLPLPHLLGDLEENREIRFQKQPRMAGFAPILAWMRPALLLNDKFRLA